METPLTYEKVLELIVEQAIQSKKQADEFHQRLLESEIRFENILQKEREERILSRKKLIIN